MRWTVLIPAKALPDAKSRLAGVPVGVLGDTDPDAAHVRLVEAIRADTVAAAAGCAAVSRIVLVVDEPDGVDVPDGVTEVLVQTVAGLNPALTEAAEHAAARWPDDGVAALLGDLPTLRAGDLGEALLVAASVPRGYVADATGTGTTLLTALPGERLDPQFGPDSAARHAAGAHPLPASERLRHDVDTAEDLRHGVDLGLGPATQAALDGRFDRLPIHPVHLDSA